MLASTSGFLALFTKFTYTEMGKSYGHYIPMIGGVANFFCFGILFWSLSLVVSKLITIFIATAEPMVDEIREEMHDVIEKIDHMAHDAVDAVDHFAHDLMAKEEKTEEQRRRDETTAAAAAT
jgi:uncharacterized membrane protein